MDAYLGMIALFPTAYIPDGAKGWMPCRGQIMKVSQEYALFTQLGYAFGGDGKTTFALPNLVDQAPKGLQYLICVKGPLPIRP